MCQVLHIVDFLGSRRMETAPTSIEVLLRPTQCQSDEPSDLRGFLSPTIVYTAPGSPRRYPSTYEPGATSPNFSDRATCPHLSVGPALCAINQTGSKRFHACFVSVFKLWEFGTTTFRLPSWMASILTLLSLAKQTEGLPTVARFHGPWQSGE